MILNLKKIADAIEALDIDMDAALTMTIDENSFSILLRAPLGEKPMNVRFEITESGV